MDTVARVSLDSPPSPPPKKKQRQPNTVQGLEQINSFRKFDRDQASDVNEIASRVPLIRAYSPGPSRQNSFISVAEITLWILFKLVQFSM